MVVSGSMTGSMIVLGIQCMGFGAALAQRIEYKYMLRSNCSELATGVEPASSPVWQLD